MFTKSGGRNDGTVVPFGDFECVSLWWFVGIYSGTGVVQVLNITHKYPKLNEGGHKDETINSFNFN